MDPVYLTEEHRMLRETARRYIDEEVEPHGDAWEAAEEIPRGVFARMGELGFFGVQAPEAYGGTDMGPVAMVAQWEELGKSSYGGFCGSTSAHAEMAVPHLINAGNDEQKKRLLPDLIAGRKVSSIAVTEPDGGSDVAGLKTRAERKGNDRWVLNGAKVFITNGVLSDVYFVAARTDPHAKGSRGISMFIVEKGAPGFTVAKKLDKHGWRCSDTAELVFDDCEIPYENILGEENKGFYAVMMNFQNERSGRRRDECRLDPERAGNHDAICQGPQGIRRHAVGQAGGAPQAGDAGDPGRGVPPSHLSLRLAGRRRPGLREGSLDDQGDGRRTGQPDHV